MYYDKPLWVTVKIYNMEIRSCVLKELFVMIYLVIYGRLLVKKFRNWKTGIHRYEINAHNFFNKDKVNASQYIGRVLTLIYLL